MTLIGLKFNSIRPSEGRNGAYSAGDIICINWLMDIEVFLVPRVFYYVLLN